MYEISKYEFQKWVDTLDVNELSKYEITMLNIILDNFELIASGGTAGGIRAKNIGRLITEQKNETQSTLHNAMATKADNKSVLKIKELQVEYFRGFGVKQTFEFDKQYTFFHGPNGSGKTSFCEALEYSLLGNIEEATARNIPVEKYIIHAGRKKAVKPGLKCIYNDGTEDICAADLAKYRFSFIEKNRIEEFSHIGAVSAKNQMERMAALFGLSEFQEFVKGFSAEIDKKYIKLESDTEEKIKKEKERLEEIERNLENEKHLLVKPKQELEALILSLGDPSVLDVESAITYLDNPETGLIPKLVGEMKKNHIPLVDKDKFVELHQHCSELISAYKKLVSNNSDILADVQSLNLRALYNAIIDLSEDEHETFCPACLTPISQTRVNPFVHAKEEISKFSKIENAKTLVKENAKTIGNRYKLIKQFIDGKEVKSILSEINYEIFKENSLDVADIELLKPEVVEVVCNIENVINILCDKNAIESRIKTYNEEASESNKVYEEKLKSMQEIYKKMIDVQATIEAAKKNEKRWKDDLEENLPKLVALETQTEKEKSDIKYNTNMVMAYQALIKKLNGYIATLPIKMAENLSDKAKEYYNYINAGDADFELINELRLPVATNEKIVISMQDGTEQDALQILSEGHVKILGLSILLAKAMETGITFLIFDDIVNSIDDDHREGVAQLLIGNKDFENMQMILTCHGELFVSSLEENVKDKKTMARYMFLPADTLDERGVFIKYQDSAIPLKVAREKYEEGNLKDSASKCRQAVECITGKLWKKISPTLGGISVKLRNLQGGPDLYNITGALKTATKEKDIEGIAEIHGDLEQLMGNRMWTLLNKGTHIDTSIPEFNRGQVKELLELLEKLAKEVDGLKVIAKVK